MNRLIEYTVFRVRNRLTLGHLPHQALPAFGEPDHRWRGPATLLIRDHDRLAAFHDGNDGVGGTQVDSDDLTHLDFSPLELSALHLA
jgi:NAD-dependent glutamate dehydrogenase